MITYCECECGCSIELESIEKQEDGICTGCSPIDPPRIDLRY